MVDLQHGDKLTCPRCSSVYRIDSFAKHRILEKDDGRCKSCRLVITSWPQKFGLHLEVWKEEPRIV